MNRLPIFCYWSSFCQQQSPILIEWGKKAVLMVYVILLDFISLNFKLVSLGPAKSGLCQPLSLLVTLISWVALFAFLSALWLNWQHFAFCSSGVIFCWQCLVIVTDLCPCGMGRTHWLVRCINAVLLNDMQKCLCATWQLNGCQWERLLSTDKKQHLYSRQCHFLPFEERHLLKTFFFSPLTDDI